MGHVVSREACLSGKLTPFPHSVHKAPSTADSLKHTFFRGGFNTVNSSALYFPTPNSPAQSSQTAANPGVKPGVKV